MYQKSAFCWNKNNKFSGWPNQYISDNGNTGQRALVVTETVAAQLPPCTQPIQRCDSITMAVIQHAT